MQTVSVRRVVLVVVAVLVLGALQATVKWLYFNDDDDAVESGQVVGGTTTSRSQADVHFAVSDYSVGDCVIWDEGEGEVSDRVVECTDPHYLEITGSREMSGADDEYPTERDFDDVAAGPCTLLAGEYLGGFNPFGILVVRTIFPVEESWRSGERTVWCGVGSVNDPPATISGPASAIDQEPHYEVGTCLVEALPESEVACEEEHRYEIVGLMNLVDRFQDVPSDDEWTNLAEECVDVASAFVGEPFEVTDALSVWLLDITAESWRAGERTAECAIVHLDGNGEPTMAAGSILG